MPANAPPRAPGELAEIEAIIRRHVWARVNGDAAEILGFGAAAAEIAALRASRDGGEAMETELRPFKDDEGEGLDEVVIYGSHIVHAETMSDTALWIGIHDQAGGLIHIWVNAVRRKGRLGIVMTATDEGDRATIKPEGIALSSPTKIKGADDAQG